MKTRIVQHVRYLSFFICLLFCTLSIANAQQDSSVFKLLPKHYPAKDGYDKVPPPKVVFAPKLVFPTDPALHGKKATVYLLLFVTTEGTVREAKVSKSTDTAFNKYAISYGKQLKFQWPDDPDSPKKGWVTYPVHFVPDNKKLPDKKPQEGLIQSPVKTDVQGIKAMQQTEHEKELRRALLMDEIKKDSTKIR
ncbi:MAG TPA: energy transducer TonB [Bacteroidota bacterium]|nr:energy transducer TonB [Bacteroidota bacterium]